VTSSSYEDVVGALRRSKLFAELPDEDVDALARASRRVDLEPGDVLIQEGAPGDAMYVVTSGELEVTQGTTGVPVLLNVVGAGDLVGELGPAHGRPRTATIRARTPASVQRIGVSALDRLLAHPRTARALMVSMSRRLDRDEQILRQRERMAALGSLAAGLLHELNNPASAVVRGAQRLRALLVDEDAPGPLGGLCGAVPVPEDPLARADSEEAVRGVLADAGVDAGWEAAGELVRLGVAPGALADALAGMPREGRGPAVRELVRSGQIRALLEEVVTGAEYLSGIVSGARPLAYAVDEALTDVDLHESLERSLVLLRHKVPPGVQVVRDLDPEPQQVQGWAADLALVWTNLLDNALAAMGAEGTLTVRTRGTPETVVVDIENTGPPVPPEVLERAFDAFYTTKPIGQGTGLGLATSQAVVERRHRGRLTLGSADGVTRARVELPRRH
jgi:signal transduction histidine kinase